ncbi:MAG: Gfo/Idh/MocA family oxidoreductase [Phycisphaerae bacterium]|nr:Gfo/Idh/MocA family oxidoreductase [Phycisphaerae bacterium]
MVPNAPRRDFLKSTLAITLAGGPFGAVAAAGARSALRSGPNGKLAIAKIACGGMGQSDLGQLASHAGVSIVGLCDIDRNTLDQVGKDDKGNDPFKDVPKFQDWREMLAKLGDKIDAVCISTPDHSHAIASMKAMEMGKHVYTQKPLARSAGENRMLADAAKAKPSLVTQMGTQRSATAERRLAYELVRNGAIGKIKAMHAWTDRPAGWWPSGKPRAEGSDPVPAHVAWDIWLGPAPARPYKKDLYHAFNWRGTRDFGTGAFGDMACHIVDMPYYALGLTHPTEITCDAPDGTDDQYPNVETVRMKFAANERTAADGIEFIWYDGGRLPDFKSLGLPETLAPSDRKEKDAHGCLPLPKDGAVILVGEGGVLVIPIQWQLPFAFVDGKRKDFDNPHKTTNHWHDWVDACMGQGKARAPFELAGLMCESLAIGAVASRYPGKTLVYDAASFAFKGHADSTTHLKPTWRTGW